MARKSHSLLRLYRTFKRWLSWLLIATVCAFLCIVRSPTLANTPNLQNTQPQEITNNLLKKAEHLQASGYYRRACVTLLESLSLPAQECKVLMRDESSSLVTERLANLSNSPGNTAVLVNLGNVLRVVGALKNSEAVLQKSLVISRSLQSNSELSTTLVSLGNTQVALGKREENYNNQKTAQTAYTDALKYYQEAIATSNTLLVNLQAKLNLLNLLTETSVTASIEDLPRQIQLQIDRLPVAKEVTYARLDLARSLTCLKLQHLKIETKSEYLPPIARICSHSNNTLPEFDTYSWQDIAQQLAIGIQQSKTFSDSRIESYALGQLGELYEITQQWSNAQILTEQALRLAQSIQAWDIAYRWQWQLGRLKIKGQQDITNALKNYTAAFDTLQILRKDLRVLAPDVQFNFRDEIEPVYRELVDLLLQAAETDNQENLIKARNVIESLQLAELNNFFREYCLTTKPQQIDLIDPNAAVIYPVILPNRLEVIVSLPDKSLLHHAINVSEEEVNETVVKFQKILVNPLNSIQTFKTASQKLYDWLLKPVEDNLEMEYSQEKSQIKTLVFVLDGALRNIPIASLYNGKNYLVERYAIALAPSLQLLDPKTLAPEQMYALIGGLVDAPSFKKDGFDFNTLQNVSYELNEISKQLPKIRELPQEKFNLNNIQNQVSSSNFSIVHLATHGKFSSNPDETFILAWDEQIKVKELDKLLRQQNQPQSEPIELLVLSACQTAQGDNRAALGLAGVAVRAGARSTIASLWQVNDASTANLMSLFYQNYKKPQVTKAEALRQAQLTLLRDYPDTDYTKPYYWAAFVIIGNWF
ncbi:hypothetical protein NIES2119_30145 [[Phormidium ambiguum] IAM M-71]|uniref:CHAT domain-containing protein n=1 Tax=[Phormidium ambiguum] IAM M-71 TaxID=454136 RepID=A0A1U7I3U2_9CYAN|nr:CHAT domain-containing protein [Phormidium ambiguum]OKH30837.1 hypothetical protein NIES2119_30145 [Phormidium ambiguum IAM M-71]